MGGRAQTLEPCYAAFYSMVEGILIGDRAAWTPTRAEKELRNFLNLLYSQCQALGLSSDFVVI